MSVIGCTAPQGKKLASIDNPPPVAVGPATSATTLTLANSGEFVNLSKSGIVTVQLPAYLRNGLEWRLAELPDPSVLEVVDRTSTPPAKPTGFGEQTMAFKATGPGDVRVRLWYGTLWASPMDARVYEFTVAVNPEEPAVVKTSTKKKTVKKKPTQA